MICLLLFIVNFYLTAQENVSVLQSGERLLISTQGQFALESGILEEDAALLARAKARYASIQNATLYLMKHPSIVPSMNSKSQGAILMMGLISIEEETPDKMYADGQQHVVINTVMALNLNSLNQRFNQIQNKPWLFKTYEMEYERFDSLSLKLLTIASQNQTSGFKEVHLMVKQFKSSEWVSKGLRSNNAAVQVQQFDQAILLDPDYAFARFQRGKAYSRLKAYEKALENYDSLIDQYPGWTELYHARGLIHGYLENYEKVIQDYQMVLNEYPDCISALINRGIAYSKTDQLEPARKDYQKVLESHPQHVVANYNLGCIHTLQGDTSAALKAIESALQNGYSDFDAIFEDDDLKPLQDNPEFKKMIDQYKKLTLE